MSIIIENPITVSINNTGTKFSLKSAMFDFEEMSVVFNGKILTSEGRFVKDVEKIKLADVKRKIEMDGSITEAKTDFSDWYNSWGASHGELEAKAAELAGASGQFVTENLI